MGAGWNWALSGDVGEEGPADTVTDRFLRLGLCLVGEFDIGFESESPGTVGAVCVDVAGTPANQDVTAKDLRVCRLPDDLLISLSVSSPSGDGALSLSESSPCPFDLTLPFSRHQPPIQSLIPEMDLYLDSLLLPLLRLFRLLLSFASWSPLLTDCMTDEASVFDMMVLWLGIRFNDLVDIIGGDRLSAIASESASDTC